MILPDIDPAIIAELARYLPSLEKLDIIHDTQLSLSASTWTGQAVRQ